MNVPTPEKLERIAVAYAAIKSEISRVIVGQDAVIHQILTALLSRGHCLLLGVPGLAKTLIVRSLGEALDLSFNRVQFTPDLMPSDITGTEILDEESGSTRRSLRFVPGPIFTNLLLADEINRTPPKTQAALLEAMQEAQVTVGGVRHPLNPPFFVLATQNPIEQEGTYPLPEAQQDRFMFKVLVGYPPYADEFAIAERTTGGPQPELKPVLALEEILRLQEIVRRVPVAPSVIHYALNVVRSTRPSAARRDEDADQAAGRVALPAAAAELIDRMVTFGAGPRAVQFLLLGAKVRALLNGRHHVSREDLQALAHPVLRHRIITNYAAEAEGYDTDRIIEHILESLPAGRGDESANAQFRQVFTS